MPAEASGQAKVLACAGLVTISTLVGVLYKSSQSVGGGFRYSTTSAITIAEAVKLVLSVSFHILESRRKDAGNSSALSSAWVAAKKQLSLSAVLHIWLLSLLYAFNNQLSFFVYMMADPGTIFIFKSGSTLVVAIIQYFFVGKKFQAEQWRAMLLQACGMIVVQYDACKRSAIYRPLAYLCMVISTAVTAISSARNEYLVKNYSIDLNVQNATLYAGGFLMNLLAFGCCPNPNSSQAALGFFDGYDNPLALGVVFANALIGLAITAVYKYADAVTKCIAGDITAVLLCIVSTLFFGLQSSLTMWCGVFVVCFAVHIYIEAGSRQPVSSAAPVQAGTAEAGSKQLASTAAPEQSGTAVEKTIPASIPSLVTASGKMGGLEAAPPVKSGDVMGFSSPVPRRYFLATSIGVPVLCLVGSACVDLHGITTRTGIRNLLLEKLGVQEAIECFRSVLAAAEANPDVGSADAAVEQHAALTAALRRCMTTL